MSEIAVPEWRKEWGHHPPLFANPAIRKAFFDHRQLGIGIKSCAGIAQMGDTAAKVGLRKGKAARAKAERGELLEGAEPFWLAINLLDERAKARCQASLVRNIHKASQGSTEEVVEGRNPDGSLRTRVRKINGDWRASAFMLKALEAGCFNFERRLQVDARTDPGPMFAGGDDYDDDSPLQAAPSVSSNLSVVGMPLEHLDKLILALSDEESHEEIL